MSLVEDIRVPSAAELAARRARLGIRPTLPVVVLPARPRMELPPSPPAKPKPRAKAKQPEVPVVPKNARKAVVSLAVKVRFLWEGGLPVQEIADRLSLRLDVAEKLVELIECEWRRADRRVTTRLVKYHVCEKLGFRIEELDSARRFQALVCARQIAAWALSKFTTLSLPQIGRQMGGRDHTTILHAVRVVEDMLRAQGKAATDFVGAIDAVDYAIDNLLVGGVWRSRGKGA